MSKVYGYIRSRTYKDEHIKQCPYYIELEGIMRQLDALDRLFYDGYKTLTENRKGLIKLLQQIEKDSIIICHSIDRIVKGNNEAIELLEYVLDKNVTINFLTGSVKQIDRETIEKTSVREFLEMLKEAKKHWHKDKSLIERLQFNVKCHMGRRPTRMSRVKLRLIQKDIIENQLPITEIMKRYNMTSATIYKYVSPTGELRPHGEQILDVNSYLLDKDG